MRDTLERAKTDLTSAEAIVGQAAQLGMDMAEAEFELHEAKTKLTQARTYVHSFSLPTMQPIADQGAQHARLAEQQGEQAIREFHFRRHGLWVVLGILALLIVGLILLLRQIERR
jgi:hypothetical protein